MKKDFDIAKLESIDSFGDRRTIIPLEVTGFFHRWRSVTQLILIAFFLLLPWTQWSGKQTIWLNIAERQFTFLGLTLSAHDTPLIFIFIIVATLALAVVTAVLGRVWCGWACPQTVFIEGVYRRIERWIEGNAIQRRALRDRGSTREKVFKGSLKWIAFFIVSSIFAHSFAAYFIGAQPLLEMIHRPPNQNLAYFVLISAFTALLLFDFGWFREQFCVIACPYGRIQSLLMDSQSLTVTYDEKRGEPRKGVQRGDQKQGDCVACMRCVAVCPTGIDIRNGQQMECIACTACIDACDEIMTKVNKPTGLIRYSSIQGNSISFFRARPLLYLLGIAMALGWLAYSLNQRLDVDITIIRQTDTPYEITNNKIINHHSARLINQSDTSAIIELTMQPNGVELVAPIPRIELKPRERRTVHFFFRFDRDPSTAQPSEVPIEWKISTKEGSMQTKETVVRVIAPSPM